MIRYYPIDPGIHFECVGSDLVSFHWQDMAADFEIPSNTDQLLRVSFDSDAIVRLLDEMPLSTESDPALWEGLIPNHFAYRVEGAAFVDQQSQTWLEIMSPVMHFQFITGSGCVDVVTRGEPRFSLVPHLRATSASAG